MDVVRLKAQIQSKELESFYIFTGEEWYMQRLYIKQIAKSNSVDYEYIDDSKTLFSKLSANTLFSTSKVYVLRDDAEISKNPELIDKLKRIVADNIIILILSSVDKRTKLYKTYKDSFIEFSTLEHVVLKRHIKAEIDLSDRNIDRLIDICEGNYGRILLEIDKIKEYANAA